MIYSKAVAYIKGSKDAKDLGGKVTFYQRKDSVLVEADIFGLPKDNKSGFFAFHIHEGTSCEGENFNQTLMHYNPDNSAHPIHRGDLPPLLSYSGNAFMIVITDRFRVDEIIGKTVVIHFDADDFTSQPSGNSGKKIACGVIEGMI